MTTATELAALSERLSNHIENTERDRAEDKLERQIAAAERQEILSQLRELHHDMKEVKPVTDMVSSLRARVSGGVMVLGFIGAIAWSGMLFFKDVIVRFLTGGTP